MKEASDRAKGDGATPPRVTGASRSPRRQLAAAMPLGSIWTARSTFGHMEAGPMRLVSFRSNYMEFDAGQRHFKRIGYPAVGKLEIAPDCNRITLIENGFIAVFERQ